MISGLCFQPLASLTAKDFSANSDLRHNAQQTLS